MIDPSVSSTSEWTTDCGMDDDVDRRRRRPEQPVRLDHLEALVHQRRRVDGDLAAHPPGRMAERGVDGDAGQRLGGQVPERPARRGQDQPAHLRRIAPVQALVDGVVLAVDRQHVDAVGPGQVHHQAAGHHQHFLVGERDALAGADRRDHRLERGRAGRRAQHGVDVVARDQVDQRLRSGAAQVEVGGRAGRELRAQRLAGGVGGHHHRARPVALDLQRHRRRAGAGGEADHLEPIGVRVDDGQRAVADRAGRAEDREAHRSGSHGVYRPV